MKRTGTILWFARHEARLAWRDWLSLMSGPRRSGRRAALGLIVIALLLHAFAYLVLHRYADLSGPLDRQTMVMLTGVLAFYGSLMLSQAMERVARGFYGRADLDLVLSSPVAAWRLFAARIAGIWVSTAGMSLALAGPLINVLSWFGGSRWLAGYGVVAALAMAAVAVAVVLTLVLLHTIGPKRTRLCAQIIAAVIGAGFAIGVQLGAILAYGTPSRVAFLNSEAVMRYAPGSESILWWPARALVGDLLPSGIVFGISAVMLTATIYIFAPQFGQLAIATAGVSQSSTPQSRRRRHFRRASPIRALRCKEWMLLQRDPWLTSQTLMQLLYLLPPGLLLWRTYYNNSGASAMLVPILIIAAGQLAGSLAWLAISGEDAPDLIASAPVTSACVVRGKTEAVMGLIAIIFAPFVVALGVVDPASALISALGVITATASAISIQFWFRGKGNRRQFRRRLNSSVIASLAEALALVSWAAAGAFAVASIWLGAVQGLFALAVLGGAWVISPARNRSGIRWLRQGDCGKITP